MARETIFGKARMDVLSDLRRVWDQKYAEKKSILNFTCHKFSFAMLVLAECISRRAVDTKHHTHLILMIKKCVIREF